MGSSGGTSNPAYLSQGTTPIPNLPIAGQDNFPGAKPQEFGAYQSFLPDIPAAGQGPAPLARGLTAEMLKFRSPTGILTPGSNSGDSGTAAAATAAPAAAGGGSAADIQSLRDQLAQLQASQGAAAPYVNPIAGTGSPAAGGLWAVPPATS